jgi:hypothetical protein
MQNQASRCVHQARSSTVRFPLFTNLEGHKDLLWLLQVRNIKSSWCLPVWREKVRAFEGPGIHCFFQSSEHEFFYEWPAKNELKCTLRELNEKYNLYTLWIFGV